MKKPVLLLFGPTACGKSALALTLSHALDAEIVSADSMQVYRGMDIGTAKPSMEEREQVAHHCLDLCGIEEFFTVADYRKQALCAIDDILARGKLPLVVGGTGLYFDSLLYKFSYGASSADPPLRAALQARLVFDGSASLHAELQAIDPLCASRIHPRDEKRIVRALEIYHSTGLPPSEAQTKTENTDYDFCAISLNLSSRDALYARCDARFDTMIQKGLVEEVCALMAEGLDKAPSASQAIGYKEFAAFLREECDLASACELVRKRTRNYAKRQITWFSRYTTATPLFSDTADCIEKAMALATRFLEGALC